MRQKSVDWEFLEHVRRRPVLYLGGTGERGLHHMFYIVLDESLAEVAAGACSQIHVTIGPGNRLTVVDNGAVIPSEEVTPLVTTPGIKRRKDRLPGISIIEGQGMSVVNALSDWFVIEMPSGPHLWNQQFACGEPLTTLKLLRHMRHNHNTGMRVAFSPDRTIIDAEFDYDTIARRCRDAAYTLRGVTIYLRDENSKQAETFFADKGLAGWPGDQGHGVQALHPVVHAEYEDAAQNIRVEVAFQFTDDLSLIEHSFCNSIPTPDHGTHLDGMRAGILAFINRDARARYDFVVEWDDVSAGYTGAVSLFHPQPSFENRLKVQVGNPEVFDITKRLTFDALCWQFPDCASFTTPILEPLSDDGFVPVEGLRGLGK